MQQSAISQSIEGGNNIGGSDCGGGVKLQKNEEECDDSRRGKRRRMKVDLRELFMFLCTSQKNRPMSETLSAEPAARLK